MKLSITQPYFFPYIGFFQLIFHTDEMIILDTVNFKKQSWMVRNRILHQTKDFNYIHLPTVKVPISSLIYEVSIDTTKNWQKKILGLLTIYANKAPYYKETKELLNQCFNVKENNYSLASIQHIKIICEYLQIPFSYKYLSNMDIDIEDINHPGDWSLLISKKLNAAEYINMPSGAALFNEKKFLNNNIKLTFLNPQLKPYNQKNENFISHLSIIDLLMWNSKEEIFNIIKNDVDFVSQEYILKTNNA